jgi:hypothetical protein
MRGGALHWFSSTSRTGQNEWMREHERKANREFAGFSQGAIWANSGGWRTSHSLRLQPQWGRTQIEMENGGGSPGRSLESTLPWDLLQKLVLSIRTPMSESATRRLQRCLDHLYAGDSTTRTELDAGACERLTQLACTMSFPACTAGRTAATPRQSRRHISTCSGSTQKGLLIRSTPGGPASGTPGPTSTRSPACTPCWATACNRTPSRPRR